MCSENSLMRKTNIHHEKQQQQRTEQTAGFLRNSFLVGEREWLV